MNSAVLPNSTSSGGVGLIRSSKLTGRSIPPVRSPPIPFVHRHEMAALAYLLTDPDDFQTLSAVCADDFTVPAHRLIFDAAAELRAEQNAVNELSVTDRLRDSGRLDACGGPAAITHIANETTSAAIAHYAVEIMREASAQRAACGIGKQLHDGQIGLKQAIEELRTVSAAISASTWLNSIERSVVMSSELAERQVRPRNPLLSPFLYEGDYGIYCCGAWNG